MQLCEYGYGREATYQFKNGKYCCREHYTKCPAESLRIKNRKRSPEIYKIIAEKNRGQKRSKETKKKIGLKSKEKFKDPLYMEQNTKLLSKYWKCNHTKFTKEKMSISAKKSWTVERKKKFVSPFSYLWKDDKWRSEKISYMVNGGAAYCNKFIKNPSKLQVKLFNICQIILPYPILNYPCLNYSIDIAVPKLNIAIEYDGSYWHPDKQYDLNRQKELEEEGWKFLRYVDYIPSETELLKNITEIL